MSPKVQGFCPACGGDSLFLGAEGYVTCSRLDCAEPDAASTLLEDHETQHIVTFRELDFTIRHPLRERLRGELLHCDLHAELSARTGPPPRLGSYRVYGYSDGTHVYEPIGGE